MVLEVYEKQILQWLAPDAPYPSPTAGWFLASLDSAVLIVCLYLLMIFIGPMIMKNREPIDVYSVQFVYNPVQVMLCSYMCIESILQAYRGGYSFLVPCNPYSASEPIMANVLWLFYISKVLDFLDTAIIILKKKDVQLSFLHTYHHSTIFLMYWVNLNVGFDGDIYLTIILNGFIHAIMYTYYFVTLHTKQVWWKKYMTSMQLIQFLLMNAQAIYLLYSECTSFPPRVTMIYLVYIQSLFWLFMNFFIKNFFQAKKSSEEKKAAQKQE